MTLNPATSLKRLCFALALALTATQAIPTLRAQDNLPPAQLTPRSGDDLAKLSPFTDSKDWDGALNLLNGMLDHVKPDSYDQAIVYDIISKVYLQQGVYTPAMMPMERAYQLGVTHPNYFQPKTQLQRLYYLAQLYYQETSTTKKPALRIEFFDKATKYIEIWLADNPKPTAEGRLFYTTLLYNQAVLDPKNIDKVLLKKAQEQAREGLVSTLNPKQTFYVILLAIFQQEENHARSAELLELLVKQYPSKKIFWQQLSHTYATLASLSKSEDDALEYNLRSILTIERAQAFGLMTSPKDNFNLVAIYYNIKKFAKATSLLYKGLKDGSIESDQAKWERLAFSYQQINKEFQAIEVLKEAAKLYPTSGQLDNRIAQIYYSMNKVTETHRHLNLAIAKGGITNPADTHYFKAYVCYELLKYEEALVAIDKAAEIGDGSNKQLPQLRRSIASSLAERAATKKETQKPQE